MGNKLDLNVKGECNVYFAHFVKVLWIQMIFLRWWEGGGWEGVFCFPLLFLFSPSTVYNINVIWLCVVSGKLNIVYIMYCTLTFDIEHSKLQVYAENLFVFLFCYMRIQMWSDNDICHFTVEPNRKFIYNVAISRRRRRRRFISME